MPRNPPFRTLIDRTRLLARIHEIAAAIRHDMGPAPVEHGGHTSDARGPLLVSVAFGARVFCDHLVSALQDPIEVREVRARSYGDQTESSGTVQLEGVESFDPFGRDVVIVEDIVDTGRTVALLKEKLEQRGAVRVEVATLLTKPARRVVEVPLRYAGFEIEDHFVIGFGMDFAEKYRDIPQVVLYDAELERRHESAAPVTHSSTQGSQASTQGS